MKEKLRFMTMLLKSNHRRQHSMSTSLAQLKLLLIALIWFSVLAWSPLLVK